MKKLSNSIKIKGTFNFYLCHGFGLDSSYFAGSDGLIEALRDTFPNSNVYSFDLGFFGSPTRLFPTNKQGINIGIGHSFGVAHLYGLRKQLNLNVLISLSGFLQFVFDFNKDYFDKFELGINKYPLKTLQFFYSEANLALPSGFPDKLDTAFLSATLTTMKHLSLPPELELPIVPMVSKDDTIVSRSLSEANFGRSNFIASPNPVKHSLGKTEVPFIINELLDLLSISHLFENLQATMDA